MNNKKFRLTYTQIIVLGFLALILIGAGLLTLPVASRSGDGTPFIDCLFTSTSATCVTGLIVQDTATHWSLFGQIVIITLIQIGGLGFMTVITMFSIFAKRKISLRERRLLMQSAGTIEISGIIRTIKRILIGTFFFEGIGALILSIRFIPKMGFFRGAYNAVFHSVSSFCNAGFDIMGKYSKFSSLTLFADDWLVCSVLMALTVIGGIGFIVWSDMLKCRLNFKKYELHTKIVLSVTAFLLIGGFLLFFFFEQNASMQGFSTSKRILSSLFQSITTRTAGFNSIDQAALSEPGSVLTMVLMFIGGSPGSCAGGIKTTTAALLIFEALASARGISSVTMFKRRFSEDMLKTAASVVTFYILAILTSSVIILSIETFPLKSVLYEVISAIGTVGLTTGITSSLSAPSLIILMLLMYGGRVGMLSLVLAITEKRTNVPAERPVGKILIG